jgi:ABC-type uncharacterized transport system YnjBCD permease subunit
VLLLLVLAILALLVCVPRLRDKVIPEWRQAWRMDTVRAAAALTFLSFIQAEVLPLIEFAVPVQSWPYITGGFGLVILLLRMRVQPEVHAPKASS